MTPDIRIKSIGAAFLYGLAPLTDAGRDWVEKHAIPIGGGWGDGTFWMQDHLLPRQALKVSGLQIVCGIGDTDEHDMPARDWL